MTTIQEKIDETEVLADSPFSVARDVSIAKLEIGFEGSFSEKSKRDSADYKVTSLSWLIFEREQPMQPQDYAVWSGVVFLSVLLVSFVLGFDSSIHQATGIGAGLFFGSLGTLITCSIPIALFIFVPRYRRHINSMLVSKSIADILLAISFLLTPVWEKFHDGDENSCKYLSFFRQYFIMLSQLWFLCIGLDLRVLTKNPFCSPKKNRRLYQVLTHCIALVLAFILSADQEYYGVAVGNFCWVQTNDDYDATVRSNDIEPPLWIFVYIPHALIFVVNVYVVYYALQRMMNGIPETLKTRKSLLREGLLTILAFMVHSAIVWGFYIAVWLSNGHRSTVLMYTFFLAFRGQVVFVLWFLHNPTSSFDSSGDLNGDPDEIRPQANTALQKELVFFTTRGIDRAVRRAASRYSHLVHGARRNSTFEVTAPVGLHSIRMRPDPNSRPTSSTCTLFDYHPAKYVQIRDHFGIETSQFVTSFRNCSKPMISEGASGAFMFFSGDNAYIVKSLTKRESDFLSSILAEYIQYIQSNPNTFVTRFLGHYNMHLYGKVYYYVVMENIFDVQPGVKLHQRYDIKGSWINRNAKRPLLGSEVSCRHCNMLYVCGDTETCPNRAGKHQPNVVLKDMDLTTKLRLGKDEGNSMLQQLQKDSAFLSSHGIMDYSLLVGVVEVSYKVDPKLARSRDGDGILPTVCTAGRDGRHSIKQSTKGLRPSEGIVGPGFYYLGIVDILQTWTWRKRMERLAKTYIMRKDPLGISVIEPDRYRMRFNKKLLSIIDHDEELFHTDMEDVN